MSVPNQNKSITIELEFSYSFSDYKICVEKFVVISEFSIYFSVSHFLWVVFSKSCAGLKIQSVHRVFHTPILVGLSRQLLSEATNKFLFGLQGAFIQLAKAVAVIQSNDVVRMAEYGMEGLVTKEEDWN